MGAHSVMTPASHQFGLCEEQAQRRNGYPGDCIRHNVL